MGILLLVAVGVLMEVLVCIFSGKLRGGVGIKKAIDPNEIHCSAPAVLEHV